MAWTGRIDLRARRARRAAEGRRFVTCAGNEVKKQRSGALRLRRDARRRARASLAAAAAAFEFLARGAFAPKTARGAAALRRAARARTE